MKTRLGFVSNSSSSSFLIAIPKTSEAVDKDSIKKMFGIVPGSFIDGMVGEELANTLLNNEYDVERVLDNWGYDSIEALLEDYPDAGYNHHKCLIFNGLKNGEYRVFEISGNSEDGTALDGLIYYAEIDDTVLEDGTIIASMH